MALHIRRVAKNAWFSVLRILFLLLVTFAMITGMVLGTEGGRIGLVKQGIAAWELWTSNQIDVSGIRSPGLGQWKFGQIVLEDLPNVPRIELLDVELQWQWRYALQNRWWFNSISANEVNVEMSEPKRSSGEAFSKLYNLWAKIPAIRLERLHVAELAISRPNYPMFTSDMDGQVEINWGALPARFLVSMSQPDNGNNYALQLSADSIDQFRLQGSLYAKPNSDWAAWLKWQLSEAAQAQWNLKIDYSQKGFLSVDVDEWSMPWQSHVLEANGKVEYDIENIKLDFLPLKFTLDDRPAILEGWIEARESQLAVKMDDWIIDPFSQLLGFSDVRGNASIDAFWLGGWRQPRLDGRVNAMGFWQTYPYSLDLTTIAGLSNLKVTQGLFELANNQISLLGSVDWITDEVDFDIDGTIESDPLYRQFIPKTLQDATGRAQITGRISGPVRDPSVALKTKASGLWRNDSLRLTGEGRWYQGELNLDKLYLYSAPLQVSGAVSFDASSGDWQSQLKISEWRSDILERLNISFPVAFQGSGFGDLVVSGNGSDFTLAGDVAIQGLWQEWPLNAQIDIDGLNAKKIQLGRSKVRLGDSETSAEGSIDWSQKRIDLSFEHQEWPLSSLPPWLSFWPRITSSLDGLWSGETSLKGAWNRPAIQTNSQLVGQWFEESLSLSIVTEPENALLWDVPKFEAQWLGGQWRYQGPFKPYELFLNGQAQIDGIHVKHIPMLSREFIGNEKMLPDTMDVTVSGDVVLRGKLKSPTLKGEVSINGMLEALPITMKAQLGYLDSSYVDIDHAEGRWANGNWALDGLYDWRLKQIAMTIETDTENARHLVPWVQLALGNNPEFDWLNQWSGSLKGQLQLDNRTKDWLIDGDLTSNGELFDETYSVNWVGNGRLGQALQHDISSTWGVTELNASLVSDVKTIDGNVQVNWLNYDQLRQFNVSVPESIAGIINASIGIEGSWLNPDFKAKIATTGQLNARSAHRFSSHIDIAGNKNAWAVERSLIEIPNAISVAVEGQGSGLNGNITLDGVLPDTRYWIANEEIGPGSAAFKLSLDGQLKEPSLSGNLNWRAENWPISLVADLDSTDGQYRVDASLYSENQTRVKAKLETDQLPLLQLASQWSSNPLSLAVVVNSPLTVLDPFFVDQPDQKLTGDVVGQMNLSGSLTSPRWDGSLKWDNGSFEHASFGSLVDDIQFTVEGNGRKLSLEGAGQDGSSGFVSLAGNIDFLPHESQVFAHEIKLAAGFGNAHLLNRAQMDAAVSGALELTGSYHHLDISGELRVEPLNMQSDTFLWDGAPQLNIIDSDIVDQEQFTSRPFYWPKGEWDVNLIADNRANLYGQGISAELSGEMSVTDDLYQPVMSGRFSLIRGTYSGLGKVFQLTQGSVQIQNNQLVLDIQGEHEAKMQLQNQLETVPITLHITGNQDALNLDLSSSANLDQDEILAQLLFGKIVADLDVIQAIQLANVVNKLRTGNSGFDIIGAARDSFDLDTLVVDTESNEEGNLQFNVSAGKYINEYLYLEVEQDVGTDLEIRGSLQFQVTPNTNLELYTQGDGGQFEDNGVELNWSWDY